MSGLLLRTKITQNQITLKGRLPLTSFKPLQILVQLIEIHRWSRHNLRSKDKNFTYFLFFFLESKLKKNSIREIPPVPRRSNSTTLPEVVTSFSLLTCRKRPPIQTSFRSLRTKQAPWISSSIANKRRRKTVVKGLRVKILTRKGYHRALPPFGFRKIVASCCW